MYSKIKLECNVKEYSEIYSKLYIKLIPTFVLFLINQISITISENKQQGKALIYIALRYTALT